MKAWPVIPASLSGRLFRVQIKGWFHGTEMLVQGDFDLPHVVVTTAATHQKGISHTGGDIFQTILHADVILRKVRKNSIIITSKHV